MAQRITNALATAMAIAMVVAGIWAWQSAFRFADGTTRPDVTLWALRSGAVALAAVAQVILMTFLARVFYPRDGFSAFLRMAAGLVAAIAMISAIALGLAGR